MNFRDYSGPEQFRPLSAWAYIGYSILFLIPVIGMVFLIIFSFSKSNYNRRSFARSYWCGFVLALIIVVVLIATGVGFAWLSDIDAKLNELLPGYGLTLNITASPTTAPF